jgi:hypothetical protein
VTSVLLLDFPGRRPEAHLTDLGLDVTGVQCRSLLTHPLPAVFDTRSYAAELARRAAPLGAVDGIVAYCAAAPLAVAFGHLTGAPVVFLDPEPCDERDLADAYAGMLRQIGGDRQSWPGPAGWPADPAAMIAVAVADLRRQGKEALGRDGFSAGEAESALGHTIDVYRQWLTYLIAMRHHAQPPLTGPALRILSRRHPERTPGLGIDEARTVRVDCERAQLARHDETRKAVLEFIGIAAAVPARRG